MIGAYRTALTRPATRQQIAVVLGRLALHLRPPDLPPEHYQLVFDDYADDLAEFPISVLAEAAQDWRRTEKWWPRICELRERCQAILRSRRKELIRLEFLQWCVAVHEGKVPRLLRRIEGGLHDAGDALPDWMIPELLDGRREFGGLVFVLPEDAR